MNCRTVSEMDSKKTNLPKSYKGLEAITTQEDVRHIQEVATFETFRLKNVYVIYYYNLLFRHITFLKTEHLEGDLKITLHTQFLLLQTL